MSPSNGSTMASTTDITLDWASSSGATEYYGHLWGGPSIDINSGWTGNTDWHIGTLWAGTYQWQVKARNQAGESGWSETWSYTVSGAPNSPSDLFFISATTTSITFGWQDNSDNEDGFNVYKWMYGDIGWEFYYIDTVNPNITNYSDTTLSCSSGSFYQVSAYNSFGEFARSSWSGFDTTACSPVN